MPASGHEHGPDVSTGPARAGGTPSPQPSLTTERARGAGSGAGGPSRRRFWRPSRLVGGRILSLASEGKGISLATSERAVEATWRNLAV